MGSSGTLTLFSAETEAEWQLGSEGPILLPLPDLYILAVGDMSMDSHFIQENNALTLQATVSKVMPWLNLQQTVSSFQKH